MRVNPFEELRKHGMSPTHVGRLVHIACASPGFGCFYTIARAFDAEIGTDYAQTINRMLASVDERLTIQDLHFLALNYAAVYGLQ